VKKEKIQFAGIKPAGELHFDIKIKIDAEVNESLYEDCETSKPVPAKEHGKWVVGYDEEGIESQIKEQILNELEAFLKLSPVKLHVDGKLSIVFPDEFAVRT